jgi:uncharacterized repeat protein (TIGR01451 family)
MAVVEFPSETTVEPPPGVLESNLDNNQANEEDAVAQQGIKVADLVLTKSNGVDTVEYDDTTTYTITVTNNGPDDVVDDPATEDVDERTVLQDVVPEWMKWGLGWENSILIECAYPAGSKPANETCDRDSATTYPNLSELEAGFRLPDLLSGATYTLTISAPTPEFAIGVPPEDQAYTEISNTVTLAMFGIIEANDPSGSLEPRLEAVDTDDLKTPVADLIITKDNGTVELENGDSTTYTITVTNNGPSSVPAPGEEGFAVLRDSIPEWLTSVEIACAFPNSTKPETEMCDEPAPPTAVELSSNDGFALPPLQSGDSYTIEVSGVVDTSAASISNTATVEAPAHIFEANLANNTSTDITYLSPIGSFEADLAVVKTDGIGSIRSGGTTTYTITVTNLGPSSVTGAILQDPVVDGLSVQGISCADPPGECTVDNLPNIIELQDGFELPLLEPNDTYSLEVSMRVSTTRSSITNRAYVSVPDGYLDPVTDNNMALDQNRVTRKSSSWIDKVTQGPLSNTGSDVARLIYLAMLLLGCGAVLMVTRRRKVRPPQET